MVVVRPSMRVMDIFVAPSSAFAAQLVGKSNSNVESLPG